MKKDSERERKREFLAEAEDILSTMGRDLLKLGKGVKAGIIDPAVLNAIFRSAHTLKASSSVFDYTDMARLSHALEDTLDTLRHGRVSASNEVVSSIMTAHELLVRIAASKGRKDYRTDVGRVETLLNLSSRPARKPVGCSDNPLLASLTEYEAHRLEENIREGRNVYVIEATLPITSFDRIYISLVEALKHASELIATLPSMKKNDSFMHFDIYIAARHEKAFIESLVKEPYGALVWELSERTEAKAGEDRAAEPPPKNIGQPFEETPRETLRKQTKSVRVNIKKLDGLMNLVSELGFLKSDLTELTAELNASSILPLYASRLSRIEKLFEKKITEIKENVVGARMVHISQLFGRFDPFIERVSRETQKQIQVVTYGDSTEIDKLIIEEIADPLMHIVRNVIDHAIETPAEREAASKHPTGTITLSAYQKGNHAVVEVKDDGRGIDEKLLKKKAVEKGILTKEKADGLSRRETLELIFLPGFSTCDAVSASSGRGVGLDVVRDNISRISGTIDIDTVNGKGTRFILTIPVTLAIIDALIVEDAGVRYALPVNSISEIVAISPLPANVCETSGQVSINGADMPSVRLGTVLGNTPGPHSMTCHGVVTVGTEHKLCIIVDKVVEELDIIVKPLPDIPLSTGIAGATDLGEKGAVLVLDIPTIINLSEKQLRKYCRSAV